MAQDILEIVSKIGTSAEYVSDVDNTKEVYSRVSTSMDLVSEIDLEEVS